mgnify:CR=1 FL=1
MIDASPHGENPIVPNLYRIISDDFILRIRKLK